MDLVTTLTVLGIPTIMATVIPLIITRHFNKKDTTQTNKEAIGELKEEIITLQKIHQEDIKKLNEILDKYSQILQLLQNSQQDVLRDNIIQSYNKYYIDKRFMPIYARESLEQMYKGYKELGGNGVVDDLIEKLYSLPTEPDEIR